MWKEFQSNENINKEKRFCYLIFFDDVIFGLEIPPLPFLCALFHSLKATLLHFLNLYKHVHRLLKQKMQNGG